jgi:hypothetical protein
MKVLIAILSCERDYWAHRLVRDTWLKNSSVSYGFFVGEGCTVKELDEVKLQVSDGDVTAKVRAIITFALTGGYDYLFKCDIDTYVCLSRLLKSGFEKHDWVGTYGGSGYWLSRVAMLALQEGKDENTERPHDEDWWVGDNLRKFGFVSHVDVRFNSATDEGPQIDNDIITSHWYAKQEPYSGSVPMPPTLVFSKQRLALIPKYYEKAKEIA